MLYNAAWSYTSSAEQRVILYAEIVSAARDKMYNTLRHARHFAFNNIAQRRKENVDKYSRPPRCEIFNPPVNFTRRIKKWQSKM